MHEYNKRTSHPSAWFEGELTSGTAGNGVYSRKSVALKIQRIWGSVSGFSKAVTAKFINSLDEEINGSIMGMSDLMEYGALYGISTDLGFTGDAYQYSGILPRIYNDALSNVYDGAGAKVTLDMLDEILSKAAGYRQVRNDPGLWMMGLRMKQVVDGLQTKVQLPLRDVELRDGKIVMAAYANRPIYETDYLVPASATTSPTVTATKAAGGALADATYYYRISSVTMYGEQVAGTQGSATTETTNNTVNLTWTADANAKSYMVWRKVGGGAWTLLDIIPAKTYDGNGLVNGSVASYSDAGSRTAIAVEPLETGEQMIVVGNIHPNRGASWATIRDDDMGLILNPDGTPRNMIQYVELARTKDAYDYMLKSYLALKVPYAELWAVIRHVKVA